MFVSIVKTTASEAQAESVFLVAMFLGFVGFTWPSCSGQHDLLVPFARRSGVAGLFAELSSVAFMGIRSSGLFERPACSIASPRCWRSDGRAVDGRIAGDHAKRVAAKRSGRAGSPC
jgi:hypothetical protein